MLKPRFIRLPVFIIGLFLSAVIVRAQIATPEDSIGFSVGTDYKLARWETILDYLHYLAENSDRVELELRGNTTEGLDFALAIISSPDNLAHLEKYKGLQYRLAHPD